VVLSLVKSPLAGFDAVGIPVLSTSEDIANARLKFANGCVANITASRVSAEKMRKIRIFGRSTYGAAYISLDYMKQEGELYRVAADDAEESGLLKKLLAGKHASILFAVGLANASLFSACILPLATAYYICEAMGWEAGVDKTLRDAPQFMGLYTAFLVIGSLIVMVPGAPLIRIMWASQVINGIMLPFVLIFMLKLVNQPELMRGEFTNSRFQNAVAWSTTVIMIGLTVGLVVTAVVP